jgi:Ca-activated chloride channel homolog
MRASSLCLLLALTGCSESGVYGGGGGFGATQGGIKDMRFARELVKNGQVPPPEAFVVEGMFSEHDLPLTGGPCANTFCARGASGIAPTSTGDSALWVQVGLSSTVTPDTFKRPPTTFIFTVDVSGSMGWDYSNGEQQYPTPGALARKLLRGLNERLDARDRVAVVTYGSTVSEPLSLTGWHGPELRNVIDGLTTNGSTNMEAGLRRAIEIARVARQDSNDVRILLFTDEQPNVGATAPEAFGGMVAGAASEGIGLTVFGLGLGLGSQVMEAMSHLRGGNAFSFTLNDQIDQLLVDDWPWFTVPIAHDLKLSVNCKEGRSVAASYGFPGAETASSLDVSSIFLSKRRGALLLRLTGDSTSPEVADVHLSYVTPAGEPVEEGLRINTTALTPDARGQSWQQPSVGRTVALALLVSGMKDAATTYTGDRASATVALRAAVARFELDVQSLSAVELSSEVEFARALVKLMESNAPMGDLYDRN